MPEYRGTATDFGAFLVRTVGKVGYILGTRGQLCTPALRAQKAREYPDQAAKILAASKWDGMPVADCMGWQEMWENGGDVGEPVTTFRYPDRRTYGDYDLAKSLGLPNGPIATIPKDRPDVPICVGYYGHVGFFYRGKVYQSAGHVSGTIITDLGSAKPLTKAWEYWYESPYLDYGGEAIELKPGDNNANVGSWQLALDEVGYWPPEIKHNTNFGPTTAKCTNDFKRSEGLPEDGIVDETTFARMLDRQRKLADKKGVELKASEAMVATQAEDLNKQRAEIAVLAADRNETVQALRVLAAKADAPLS